MPTTLSQSHSESEGDNIAYTIGTTGDINIAAGENADTNAAPKLARVVLTGDLCVFSGRINFTGANTSLDFTLPADLLPAQDQTLPVVVNAVSGGNQLGVLNITASTGAVSIIQADAGAFASGDNVTLAGSYVRG